MTVAEIMSILAKYPTEATVASLANITFKDDLPAPAGVRIHNDSIELAINSSMIDNMSSISDITFVLRHEIAHICLRHIELCAGRNPALWNIAGDLEVNQTLLPARFEGALYPERFGLPDGLDALSYYRLLEKQSEQEEQSDSDDSDKEQSDAGSDAPEEQNDGQNDGQNRQDEQSDNHQNGDGNDDECDSFHIPAGTKMPNINHQWEMDNTQSINAENINELPTSVVDTIMSVASRAGGTDKYKVRDAIAIKVPPLSWMLKVGRSFEKVGRNQKGITLSRLSRRHEYLKGRKNKAGQCKVAIAVDVSGSVDKKLVDRFFSTISKVSLRDGIPFEVYAFNTSVKLVAKKWKGVEQLDEFCVGGGTSFNALIEYFNNTRFENLIVLTDGYSYLDVNPRMNTIWCTYGTSYPIKGFGKIIEIKQ